MNIVLLVTRFSVFKYHLFFIHLIYTAPVGGTGF